VKVPSCGQVGLKRGLGSLAHVRVPLYADGGGSTTPKNSARNMAKSMMKQALVLRNMIFSRSDPKLVDQSPYRG